MERLERLRERVSLTSAWDLGRDFVREARDERLTGLAGEVAFFGILSLFPALLAVAAALGSLEAIVGSDLSERARNEVVSFLNTFLTDDADGVIASVEELFQKQSGGLLTVSILGALWATSRGAGAAMRALGLVYDADDHRSWVHQRLVALALSLGTVLAVALMLGVLILGPLFGRGQDIAEALGFGTAFATAWNLLRLPLAFAVMVAWAVAVFRLAPDRELDWRHDLVGAVVTGVLWLTLSVGFRAYLATAGAANPVFGILGGVLILMLWVYLLALALLAGGELNSVLARRSADEVRGDAIADAVRARVERAHRQVNDDPAASGTARAVVVELLQTLRREDGDTTSPEALARLRQAAGSARAAVESERRVSEGSRRALKEVVRAIDRMEQARAADASNSQA